MRGSLKRRGNMRPKLGTDVPDRSPALRRERPATPTVWVVAALVLLAPGGGEVDSGPQARPCRVASGIHDGHIRGTDFCQVACAGWCWLTGLDAHAGLLAVVAGCRLAMWASSGAIVEPGAAG